MKLKASLAALLAVALLTGCGGNEVKDEAPMSAAPEVADTVLKQRSEARWRALIGREFAVAYPYYTPGYRSTKTLLQFVDSFPGSNVIWNDIKYVREECEGAKCTVRLNLTYTLLNPAPGVSAFENTRPIDETWLLIDGVWYYSP